MIIKPAYKHSCTLTFSKFVFVGFWYSPRSDEKRLTFRDCVAYSSLARSSPLINNRLVCKSVMRTVRIHDSDTRISTGGFPTYNSIFSVALKLFTQTCLLSMFTVCYKLFLNKNFMILHIIRYNCYTAAA